MPEFIWVAIPMFLLITWIQGRRMGLHDAVPRDPMTRVKSYASEVLTLLKDELSGQGVELVEERRVQFTGGEVRVEGDQVVVLRPGLQRQLPLGDAGRVSFQRRGSQLLACVTAGETGGPAHSLQVYLPVHD